MKGNTFSICGNLTKDVEERATKSGRIVLMFGLAWNGRKKDQSGEYVDDPSFFDVRCWVTEGQRDVIKGGLVKGAKVAIVDGHLKQERWEKDGQSRSAVVLMVDDPIGGLLVQRKNEPHEKPYVESYADDDIPF